MRAACATVIAWAIGWTRGGTLLIRDQGGEWGPVNDPDLVPRIYAAEQFAKNGISTNRREGKRSPLYPFDAETGTGWDHARVVRLDITVHRPSALSKIRDFLRYA